MHDEEGNEEEKGPLGGQGNLEGLTELTEWCRSIMGSETVEEFAREVVRRNAEMVAGWQVSRPSGFHVRADWVEDLWRAS
jgi:hypothetical protein